jgi:predicted SAM-dependent methyltransferase
MKLLNLGCGATRPKGPEWVNLDNLHAQFPDPEKHERAELDREPNYVNFEVLSGPLPFADETFDGVLASHFFEHFDCQEALSIMLDCKRVLKSGGDLLVSVPDAEYFLRVYDRDRNENWQELFGVTDPKNPIPTFFEAALWFSEHKAIIDSTVLRSYFTRANLIILGVNETSLAVSAMSHHLNREPFSLVLSAYKP